MEAGLDRLPRVIAQRYPELSFITIYSSEVESEASQGADFQKELGILSENRIKLNLAGTEIESVLNDLIKNDEAFVDIDIERITRRLLENSADYTPEVMPGVVLYEAHTSKVDKQLLFIGVKKEGVKIKQTANKAKVFIVLLSPKNMSVEDHLKGLNKVIKYIRPGKDVENIINAKTVQGVVKAVMAQDYR